MSEVTSVQIAEWRSRQGEGMVSTVGEYTPDEFWIVLDELAVRDARIATQEAQIKMLQSDANSWQSGYDEGRRMGAKHCMGTIDQLHANQIVRDARISELEKANTILKLAGSEWVSSCRSALNERDQLRAELAASREQVPVGSIDASALGKVKLALGIVGDIRCGLNVTASELWQVCELLDAAISASMLAASPSAKEGV